MAIQSNLRLWEILIPTEMDGEHIPDEYHQAWDKLVGDIATGVTLLPRVRGKWEGEDERSIPVRIACTKEQIEKIARLTVEHYNQEAVLFYLISSYAQFAFATNP